MVLIDFLRGSINWQRTAENQLNGGRSITSSYQRTHVAPVLSLLVALTMMAAVIGLLTGTFGGNLSKNMNDPQRKDNRKRRDDYNRQDRNERPMRNEKR